MTMSDIERSIQNIENIIVDPEFRLMQQTVEKLNELLYFDPKPADIALSHVDRLNKLWREGGFHGQSFYVTGLMHAGGEYESPIYAPLTGATRYFSQRVVSQGFVLHYAMNEFVLENDNAPTFTQKIIMRGRTLIDDPSGVDGKAEVACAFDMTRTLVEYREMTPGRAAAWLCEYAPEVKEDIDIALFEASNEREAVLNLAEVSIDVEGMKNRKVEKLIQYICHWLLGEVKFDRHFPYMISVEGQVNLFNPLSLQREDANINDILYAHAREISVSLNQATKTLGFGLSAEIIDGPQSVARPAQIPLSAIQDIQSTKA